MTQSKKSRKLLPTRPAVAVFLSAAFALAAAGWAVPPPTPAELAATADAFALRPGVIVEPRGSHAYLMTPRGQIAAVDLTGGDLEWTTAEAAKPLLLVGELLIAQAEADGAFDLVVLDAGDGRSRLRTRVELPAGVRAVIDDSHSRAFTAQAQFDQGGVIVTWSFVERRISGRLPAAAGGPPPSSRTGGAVRLDLASERLETLEEGQWTAPEPRRPDLPEDQRLAGVPGVQFVSADGRHVLTSRRHADDRQLEKYRWRLHSLAGGALVGDVANARPQASFFLAGSVLLYESRPYLHRLGDGLVSEPLELRAVDLRGGRELWSQPIRDTAYRGPYPP